jgi:hypothetical protein
MNTILRMGDTLQDLGRLYKEDGSLFIGEFVRGRA